MLDKIKFMETLRLVAEVAKISQNPLTKEEVMGYFNDLELTEEQLTMVYQYLHQPIEDVETPNENEDESDNKPKEHEQNESDEYDHNPVSKKVMNNRGSDKESIYLKMYLEEIETVSTCNNKEIQKLYMELVQGNSDSIEEITDYWLMKVVEIAKKYDSYPIIIEDVIQEGNIGLLSGLNQLLGIKKNIDVEEFLKESVQQAIENYIDEVAMEEDWEEAILAKTTLINEARKALAEENAEIPTIAQLSDYTKLPEAEIEDILRLSKDNN